MIQEGTFPFKKPFVRYGGMGGGVVLFIFIILIGRLYILSATYYQQAIIAAENEQMEEAVQLFTQSIRNYFPGNPYVSRSINEIQRIVDGYHEQGQIEKANQTVSDLTASLYAIRSFYQPFSIQLQELEQRLQSASHPNVRLR